MRDQVRALLQAHEQTGFVDELAERLAESDPAAPIDLSVPARIGRWRQACACSSVPRTGRAGPNQR
jgi:hypothetical protein